VSGPLGAAFASLAAQLDQGGPVTWGGPDLPERVDSWLEQRFAWHAIKYLRPEISLCSQVEFLTDGGRFRVDFVTENYRINLAFECDGGAFHTSHEQDEIRDRWLLTSERLWGIYHVPYRDVVAWPEWVFMIIARRHYDLFTPTALVNLNHVTGRSADKPERLGVTYRCKNS
jgi:very-short-patch-repair endonuclease